MNARTFEDPSDPSEAPTTVPSLMHLTRPWEMVGMHRAQYMDPTLANNISNGLHGGAFGKQCTERFGVGTRNVARGENDQDHRLEWIEPVILGGGWPLCQVPLVLVAPMWFGVYRASLGSTVGISPDATRYMVYSDQPREAVPS